MNVTLPTYLNNLRRFLDADIYFLELIKFFFKGKNTCDFCSGEGFFCNTLYLAGGGGDGRVVELLGLKLTQCHLVRAGG